jgi:tight adherence protein B
MARTRTPRPLAALALATLATLAAVGTAVAPAAAADPAAPAIVGVDTARYPAVAATVVLPATVSEADAATARFTVEENGERRPATVTRLPGDGLDVVLVVDTSGSMSGAPLQAAQAAAAAFLAQVPATARVAVVGFGSTPVLASPLTTDRATLAAAVSGLTASGETALYDAVGLALGQFDAAGRTRRHVVLLSDGGDTASTTALDAVRPRLAGADVRLDVAALTTAESRPQALAALADAGRGSLVSAADPAALTAIYAGLARGLANQFLVEVALTGHGPTRLRIALDHAGAPAGAEVTVDLPAALPPAPAAPTAGPDPAPAAARVSGAAALAAGGALCFGALILGLSLLPLGAARREGRLTAGARFGAGPGPAGSTAMVTTMTQRAAAVADGALERHGRRGGVNAALERAGIALRPGEFVVLVASAAAVAFALGALTRGILAGVLLAALAGLVTRLTLSVLAGRRQRRFQEQLSDNLQLMAGSLRTGYAVLQAIDAVTHEAESPSADEFRRVMIESRLGRDLDVSLQAMAARVGGDDFVWVAQAIEINRKVGGDLAEVLDNVGATIRERQRVRRQVRALSAEGRLSAYVLVALPLLLGAVLAVMNPSYFAELTRGAGLVLAGVGAVMLTIGSTWMSRMVKVEY